MSFPGCWDEMRAPLASLASLWSPSGRKAWDPLLTPALFIPKCRWTRTSEGHWHLEDSDDYSRPGPWDLPRLPSRTVLMFAPLCSWTKLIFAAIAVGRRGIRWSEKRASFTAAVPPSHNAFLRLVPLTKERLWGRRAASQPGSPLANPDAPSPSMLLCCVDLTLAFRNIFFIYFFFWLSGSKLLFIVSAGDRVC